ncbi:unnamed protein product, partial [Ectocarpus fasciculatus]
HRHRRCAVWPPSPSRGRPSPPRGPLLPSPSSPGSSRRTRLPSRPPPPPRLRRRSSPLSGSSRNSYLTSRTVGRHVLRLLLVETRHHSARRGHLAWRGLLVAHDLLGRQVFLVLEGIAKVHGADYTSGRSEETGKVKVGIDGWMRRDIAPRRAMRLFAVKTRKALADEDGYSPPSLPGNRRNCCCQSVDAPLSVGASM